MPQDPPRIAQDGSILPAIDNYMSDIIVPPPENRTAGEYARRTYEVLDLALYIAENRQKSSERTRAVAGQISEPLSMFVSPVLAVSDLADTVNEAPGDHPGLYKLKLASEAVGIAAALIGKYKVVQVILFKSAGYTAEAAEAVELFRGWTIVVRLAKIPGAVGWLVTAAGLGYAFGTWGDRATGLSSLIARTLPGPAGIDARDYPKAVLYDYLTKGLPIPQEVEREIREGLADHQQTWPNSVDELPGWAKSEVNERTLQSAKELLQFIEDQLVDNGVGEWLELDAAGEVCTRSDTEDMPVQMPDAAWPPTVDELVAQLSESSEQSEPADPDSSLVSYPDLQPMDPDSDLVSYPDPNPMDPDSDFVSYPDLQPADPDSDFVSYPDPNPMDPDSDFVSYPGAVTGLDTTGIRDTGDSDDDGPAVVASTANAQFLGQSPITDSDAISGADDTAAHTQAHTDAGTTMDLSPTGAQQVDVSADPLFAAPAPLLPDANEEQDVDTYGAQDTGGNGESPMMPDVDESDDADAVQSEDADFQFNAAAAQSAQAADDGRGGNAEAIQAAADHQHAQNVAAQQAAMRGAQRG